MTVAVAGRFTHPTLPRQCVTSFAAVSSGPAIVSEQDRPPGCVNGGLLPAIPEPNLAYNVVLPSRPQLRWHSPGIDQPDRACQYIPPPAAAGTFSAPLSLSPREGSEPCLSRKSREQRPWYSRWRRSW